MFDTNIWLRKHSKMIMGAGLLLFMLQVARAVEDYQPQQVHISIGDSNQNIVVTWVTQNDTAGPTWWASVVEFGTESLNNSIAGAEIKFTDGGSEKREMFVHKVTLTGLLPDTRYFYHCGSDLGWSNVFTFKTWKNGTNWPVRVAMYGDMGAVNAQSLPRLQQEITQGLYDAVIHVGDFAYDMNSDNARTGDEFMRQIEPIAAYVPYMTCPGNHEEAYNFSNYKARFSMPNYRNTGNMFYSWDMGPVHFVSVNTEAYYFVEYGLDPLSNAYDWLVQDLETASAPDARAERPWIILYGHRPMYCSNNDHDDCTKEECITRVGLPVVKTYGMEKLLDQYGVDLAVWAHEHSYERLWPIYDYNVLNGSTDAPYTNPKGPVHFTTGSAGCDENHDPFMPVQPAWSAFRANDYGYTRLSVYNNTHLYWEQVSDDKNGEVLDSVWLIKDTHGPYGELRSTDQ